MLRYRGGETPTEWPVPKALWLKENVPDLWERVTYLVEQMGWLTWRLTGTWAVPLNSAEAKWHYCATTTGGVTVRWPVDLLRAVGLEDLPDKVPGAVLPMGAVEAGLELTQVAGKS